MASARENQQETKKPSGTAVAERPRATWPSLFGSAIGANPWDLMRRMDEDMNQLFESLGLAVGSSRPALPTQAEPGRGFGLPAPMLWSPRIEVQQRKGELLLRADLPGVNPEDIDVSVNNGVLTISGERRQEQREEREGLVRSEFSYGSFHRAVPLPDGADESRIAATFRNGTLEITVPVAEGERGRRVKVQS